MNDTNLHGQYTTSENITSVITELSNGIPANNIFDPACGSGSLLISVAKGKENINVTGIERDNSLIPKAENLLQNSGLKYHLINADFFSIQLDHKFDLVVCNPPFGSRIKLDQEIDGLKVKNRLIKGELAFIAKTLQLLKPDGLAMFVIPEGLLSNESYQFFRDYISEKYSIQAIIALPSNSFQPYANVRSSVLIVKNSKEVEKVFFAEVVDLQTLGEIVSNFKKKTSNKNLSQGFLVDYENLRKAEAIWTYRYFRYIKDLEAQKTSSKYPLRHLSEFVSIKKTTSIITETILIQRIGNHPKVIMSDELPKTSNKKNYIELWFLNEEILPEYLKLYLNSEQGKNQLHSFVGGSVIPSLNAHHLKNIYIEVPEIATQIQIVSTAQKLLQISTTIQIATQSFYSQPFDYYKLLPLINNFIDIDSKDMFFEKLISPLAISFRIATKSSPDITSQLNNYFKMFEMIAALNSIVLLSALPQTIREEYEKAIWGDKKEYAKISFGSWVGLHRRIYNFYVSDTKKETTEQLLTTLPFGIDFYLTLSNKDLIKILDPLPEKRNKFAHGSTIPEIIAQNAVNELHPSLMKIFETLSNAYSAIELIYPQNMKKRNGLYTIKTKKLQGTHRPYADHEIQMETDLNTESIYLYNPISKSLLELLPEFIKLIQCKDCGQWSIYFYSKVDNKGANYICYQDEIHEYIEQPKGILTSL